jgi:hypothetical protein
MDAEPAIGEAVRNARIELGVWLDEWTGIVLNNSNDYARPEEQSLALIHLRIQQAWALITLHLKAIANTGIENIAAMTDFQKDIVHTAKVEAVNHLELLLQASSSPPTPHGTPGPAGSQPKPIQSAYLADFKRTMDFVWAKCAFSILLVLRLAMLLRDPPEELMQLLQSSHKVLEQLKSISVNNLAYFQILQASVEKCEKALQEWLSQQAKAHVDESGFSTSHQPGEDPELTAEAEFEGYAPKEFMFDWHFPGLNIRHVPLRLQDLFLDFDSIF